MPLDQETREARRRALAELLRERPRIGRQSELVRQLKRRGFVVTQSSVSRDLRALGVAKVDGGYVVPDPEASAGPGDELVNAAPFLRRATPAGPHLTVVITAVGSAQSVGLALDRAGWPEVVGTVAGDDTVFVATTGRNAQRRLLERLESSIRPPRQE